MSAKVEILVSTQQKNWQKHSSGYEYFIAFLLAVITAVAMVLPQPYGGYASALGTWIYDSAPHIKYLGYISLAWLFVTFLLTVFCEKAFYKWYWRKAGFNPRFSINKFIWQAHAASYSGLLIMVLVM